MAAEEKQQNRILNGARAFARKYAVAVWTVGLTFAVTIALSRWVPPDISSLFLVAVMISAWRGGLGAGLLATVFSALIDIFVFLPPTAVLSLESDDFMQLVIDVTAAVIVGTLSGMRSKAEGERRKLLELERAARIEAERANAVKDEFLAAVSHELRTPLTTIKTLTRLLLKKASPGEKSHAYLSDIASECDRQIDLVHNLLDLSRVNAGGFDLEEEKVSVEEVLRVCEKIEHIAAAARSHRISVAVAAPDLAVSGDRHALRRIVCTIIENSIKFTPDGGLIELRAAAGENGEQNDGVVCIEISDNGRGISDADLPHIFESFYRGRDTGKERDGDEQSSGVGLGLYLARSLVEAMNGKIEAVSRVGQGSVFTIRLPRWKQMPADAAESEI